MRSNISPKKLLANRNNAKLSTGPKSKVGKQTVARNALAHGLNVQQNVQDNPLYHLLLTHVLQAGYPSNEAEDIAYAITEYRRVMNAYYEMYSTIPDISDFYYISPNCINDVIHALANQAKGQVSNAETKKVVNNLMRERKQEHCDGTKNMRHGTVMKRFIRYQRKAAAHVSKALCKSNITKPK